MHLKNNPEITPQEFRKLVYSFYATQGRHDLPWRKDYSPYSVFVSEMMLQQTQVERVVPKFISFMNKFPSLKALSEATQDEVLREWKGLGYNRRALNLKKTAEILTKEKRDFPKKMSELTTLPGIGPYTASALRVFSFNLPEPVIETNIRTVYIKYFFRDSDVVSDKEVREVVEQTMDKENPRDWFSALMDLGSHIKKTEKNFSKKSAGYTKQSSFKGSNRENRSHIIELLLVHPRTKRYIMKTLNDNRTESNILSLEKEGFIEKVGQRYALKA